MRVLSWVVMTLVIGLWLLLIPSHSSGTIPSPFWIEIDSGSPYYLPKTAIVTAFAPIKWRNTTGTHHTITYKGCESGEKCLFDSGAVPPDGSYELPGLPPGDYPYFCRLHPIMRGVLT